MKRFLSLVLSLALLLSLCACNGKEETVTEGLRLYGVNDGQDRLGGDVIAATVVPWSALPEGREEQAAAVVELLLQWMELLEAALADRSGIRAVSTHARRLSASRSSQELLSAIRAIQKAAAYAQGNVSPAAICGWLVWELRS